MENEVFEGENTSSLPNFILERARYVGEVIDIERLVVKKGKNEGKWYKKIVLEIEGRKFDDIFVEGNKWTDVRWNQLLYALGERHSGKFTVSKEKILNKPIMVDIGVKSNKEDSYLKENFIQGYSPVEEQIAPISGVPAEDVKVKKEIGQPITEEMGKPYPGKVIPEEKMPKNQDKKVENPNVPKDEFEEI